MAKPGKFMAPSNTAFPPGSKAFPMQPVHMACTTKLTVSQGQGAKIAVEAVPVVMEGLPPHIVFGQGDSLADALEDLANEIRLLDKKTRGKTK